MTRVQIDIELDPAVAAAIAGLLYQAAAERRTPSGAISRSGKGDYSWTPNARVALAEVAELFRAATS